MKSYEMCCECGKRTGRAGKGEDSLYDEDEGPFCEDCYEERTDREREANSQFGVGA